MNPNPGTAPAPQDLPPPPAGQLTTQLHGLALDLQLQSQSQLPPPSQQPGEGDAPSPMDNIPTSGAQHPGPGPSSGAASPTSTHAARCPSRVWIPDIVDRIAAFLPPNEIPASVRLVNRATASQFGRDRRHVTLVATEPVPPHAFKRQWGHPGGGAAVRALSRGSRHLLVTATARTGVLENLQVEPGVGCRHREGRELSVGRFCRCSGMGVWGSCPSHGVGKAYTHTHARTYTHTHTHTHTHAHTHTHTHTHTHGAACHNCTIT